MYLWLSHFPVHVKLPQYCLSATPQYRSLRSENKIRFYSGEKKDEQSFPRVTHNLMILVTYQDGGLVLSLCSIAGFQGLCSRLSSSETLAPPSGASPVLTAGEEHSRTSHTSRSLCRPRSEMRPVCPQPTAPCKPTARPEDDQTHCRVFGHDGVLHQTQETTLASVCQVLHSIISWIIRFTE